MSGPVRIAPADGPEQLGRFLDVAYRLNADLPHWVPPLRMSEAARLTPGKNPFFEHADAARFIAMRGAEPVGRVLAIHDHEHNRYQEEQAGFFGFFECRDDTEAAGALLGAATEWLQARGVQVIRGPMNPTTNDQCGLLIEGFDTPPTLMMPHNPPFHAALIEGQGFRAHRDLLAFDLEDHWMPVERLRRIRDRRANADIQVRSVDFRHFERELETIRGIYNSAWEANWGFVPMTEAEFRHVAADLKQIAIPDLLLIAEVSGQPAAFSVTLPDFNEALIKVHNGRLFPFGLLKILWHKRHIQRARVVTLGVVPEHRRRGLEARLYLETMERAAKHDIRKGELSWILEENEAMRSGIEALGGRLAKRYRIYEKTL
ncbi:MAG: N-acetyltransferase [Planctomycetota bacterium]